jgi:NAD(P)-dependent dehydrogenase (short-subunit alcohol dehydrogenase family)
MSLISPEMTTPHRPDRFGGKTVIVTGAGSQSGGIGNGQATALTLACQGASVVCMDRFAERAQATVAAIRDEGGVAVPFAGDVRDLSTAREMVAAAVDTFGGLHGLVCNVGIAGGGSLHDADVEAWNEVLAVNVTGTMICAHAAAGALAYSGGGSIVTIGSTAGMRWYAPGAMAYATSKSALAGLTMSMAGELGSHRTRVNMVVIGQVWSPMVAAGAAHMPPDWRERRRESGLIPDEGTPWDVANAVAFLLSDESRWITGQSLVVDAGASLTMRH